MIVCASSSMNVKEKTESSYHNLCVIVFHDDSFNLSLLEKIDKFITFMINLQRYIVEYVQQNFLN